MELILVRHPLPLAAPGVCYGSSDLAVDDEEMRRAHAALCAELAAMPELVPLRIYSSPLQRCAELARLMGEEVRFDARLAEMNFGAWELRQWDEVARAEIDAWTADLLHYRPGGGESVLMMAQRIAQFLNDLQEAVAKLPPCQPLLVCHAGSIRLISALASGLPLREAALTAASSPHKIAYGAVLRLPLACKSV
ncbi:histidine phosphatase family protein [Massilia sp. NR 4-1]|uniref:histidine phosphatase family protein n=1 Tax=Massilia sp. NR 4-1 TaxID=1678028 RepID=UPI00067DFAAA|nr:histidine phosphatase family protein [Massilia sp. NR 4-1]AKU22627.1 phosphoglycerate mutase [Massilia sp. NR 4-1]